MPPTLYFERTPQSRNIIEKMDKAATPGWNGAGGHNWQGFDTKDAARMAAEFKAMQKRWHEELLAERKAKREEDKRLAAQGGSIGPPDPRKGRGRLRG